jgi:hypothetical protein
MQQLRSAEANVLDCDFRIDSSASMKTNAKKINGVSCQEIDHLDVVFNAKCLKMSFTSSA